MAAMVKGFGCRPVVIIRVRSEGRRPKASQEGTRRPPSEPGTKRKIFITGFSDPGTARLDMPQCV
jgi:hypothetical protein